MSSSSDKSRGRRMAIRKRVSNFCSTPVLLSKAVKLSSISVSGIDTNSSPSTSAELQRRRQEIIFKESRTRLVREKRKQKRTLKRKRRPRVIASDSDWETRSEQSVNEEENPVKLNHETSPCSDVLFKDVCESPEHVRRVHFDDYILESPIFQPRRTELEAAEKIDFRAKNLPLDLPILSGRVDTDEEDTEEDLNLIVKRIDRTYAGNKQPKPPEIDTKVAKYEGNIYYPNAVANQLWDKFVETNYERIKRYLVPTVRNENNRDKVSDSKRGQNCRKTMYEEITRIKPDLSKMGVVQRVWSRSLQKFVDKASNRSEDVYEFSSIDDEDPEFRKDPETGKRITFNEYFFKCKEKRDLNLPSSSSSTTNENIKRNLRRSSHNFHIIEKETMARKSSEFELTSSRMERTMQGVQHNSTKSLLKRARDIDTHESDAKRQRVIKNKPLVRSIELLRNRRYKICTKNC